MRILVADDDPGIAETVRRMLVAEGWSVDVVGDGVTALDQLASFDYAIAIVDIMMPGRNGYEVVRAMRSREDWTPVLMLTAKDGEYDQADAFDMGADDYLTKPFSFVVLMARIRALMRRGAPARPAILRAGDLLLDPAAHIVQRGDTVVALTPREYALLEFLLRNKGVVRSKTAILDAVWDLHYAGSENVVEVYISYLRQRIDVPFGRASIETVRGRGYRLADDGG
ncbi:MAG: response regulator transcription factor [Gordonia sp. (in: high G+C Gram-positive bacteria)]|uniref:response regulator transcription factor n=1 Tax=Gordonia sp. (in: high G+C Gram-positive bacteria) TaxID=84139 RepID=UPI003BB72949